MDDARQQEEWQRVGKCIDRDGDWADHQCGNNNPATADAVGKNAADRVEGEIGERVGGDGDADQEWGAAQPLGTRPDHRK